jgi:PTH1 family peptidyl-tRNA hydrolase
MPQTYMNRSGQSVAPLARFYRIAPSEVLVVHDELDFLPGVVKLKQGGGIAGHNGLRDIASQFGSPDFWRLRLGIGHPGDRDRVADWVLSTPPPADREAIEAAIERSLAVMPGILAGDMQSAMLTLHASGTPRPSKPAPARPGAAAAAPKGD